MNSVSLRHVIIGALRRNLLAILLSIGIGSALGVYIAYARGPQWEASELIQVGQIGIVTFRQGGQVGITSVPLVDPSEVVSRVSFDGFADQLCAAVGYVDDKGTDPRCALVRKTLRAQVPRTGNLIELRVSGGTAADAKNLASQALSIIEQEHQKILAPTVTRLQNTLNEVNQNIRAINEKRAAAFSIIAKPAPSTSPERKFSENVLLSSVIKSDESDLRDLQSQKETLLEQLSGVRTFNTKAMAPVFVPGRPVTSGTATMAVLYGILGLVVCIAFIFLLDPGIRKALTPSQHGHQDD